MQTLNLIMVRHGRTSHNLGLRLTGWGDPDLDELGRQQAQAMAEKVTGQFKLEALYASPLQRASQTAACLTELTGLKPVIKADLKELNFGEVEGMTIPEIKSSYPDLFKTWRSFDDPEFAWPGGETKMVFHTRVDQAIWEIIQAEAGFHTNVAIVAHGGSLAGFVSELLTAQPFQWRQFLLDNCEYYVVEVHFEQTPITRENCTLKLAYTGRVMPLGADR
jgi:broad specificity phosphatase PhoE